MSITTNEISADFRLCRVMCIGKEGTPGGCKSQVPHLIDILLTMFYFNADHLNILCLLTSICFQLRESDLAWCILWWKARSTAHDFKSNVQQTNLPEGLNKSNNVHLWLARLEFFSVLGSGEWRVGFPLGNKFSQLSCHHYKCRVLFNPFSPLLTLATFHWNKGIGC